MSLGFSSARHILQWGGCPKRQFLPLFWIGGGDTILAVWRRASECPVWGCHSSEPSQLPGSGQVKQHLSSREALLYLGGGDATELPPTHTHTPPPLPHVTQNNRKDSGEFLELNLTQAQRMRKRWWHQCQPWQNRNNSPIQEETCSPSCKSGTREEGPYSI